MGINSATLTSNASFAIDRVLAAACALKDESGADAPPIDPRDLDTFERKVAERDPDTLEKIRQIFPELSPQDLLQALVDYVQNRRPARSSGACPGRGLGTLPSAGFTHLLPTTWGSAQRSLGGRVWSPSAGGGRSDAAIWEPRGKLGQIGGGVPQLDLNGTKYTRLEGYAADSHISLPGFDPVTQPGIALSNGQAQALGVKVGDTVRVYDSQTGKTINATYYDNAGGRGPGHVEMSPRLAADFGLIRFPIVRDEISGAEGMRNRFFITPC